MSNKQVKTKGKYIAQSIFSLLAAILILLLGIVILLPDIQYLFNGSTNIDRLLEKNGGNLEKDEYVSVGVDAVVDWYAETTHKVNGIPTGKEQHCIIWLNDSSFISLTVKGKKNIEKIDKIIEGTYSYMNGETTGFPTPVVFEGKVKDIGSEVKTYFNDAVREYGLLGENVRYLTIDTTCTKGSAIAGCLIVIALTAIFIGLFIGGIKGAKRLKTAENAVANASQPYNDFNNYNNYNM